MRVLLVEDEPNAARVLAKGLREHAYAVDLAADGETALFQVGTTEYDAVILDVMLPRKDGFAVCRAIRESGCPVPILMVTARDTVDARIEGLDSGADDYLVKPFDPCGTGVTRWTRARHASPTGLDGRSRHLPHRQGVRAPRVPPPPGRRR